LITQDISGNRIRKCESHCVSFADFIRSISPSLFHKSHVMERAGITGDWPDCIDCRHGKTWPESKSRDVRTGRNEFRNRLSFCFGKDKPSIEFDEVPPGMDDTNHVLFPRFSAELARPYAQGHTSRHRLR
jgi:hypothetical protein